MEFEHEITSEMATLSIHSLPLKDIDGREDFSYIQKSQSHLNQPLERIKKSKKSKITNPLIKTLLNCASESNIFKLGEAKEKIITLIKTMI